MTNPYSTPISTPPETKELLQLEITRVSRLVLVVGLLGVLYCVVIFAAGYYEGIRNNDIRIDELFLTIAVVSVFGFAFGCMVYVSSKLRDDFEQHFRSARLAAVAGAFCFPFLTLPALYVIYRLAKCRQQVEGKFLDSVDEHARNLLRSEEQERD